MNKEIHFVSVEELPEIPKSLAVCPICGAQIEFVEVCEWDENGRPAKSGIKIECTNQPDAEDSKAWWSWFHSHYRMPYVDWLPLEEKMYKWVMQWLKYNGVKL